MTITIIIPVLDEAEHINTVIAHLRSLSSPDSIEIIVVDGDRGGSTIKALADRGVIAEIAAKGRARQMNRGAALASGDVLVFLHADTVLPAGALVQVRSAMGRARNAAGAFRLGINSRRRIFRITEWYAALRTRLTRVPFGDQAIFIRRDYFEEIGGYKDIPVMEDVDLMKRVKKNGAEIFIIPEKVRTSPRRWEREGVLCCTFRNWMLQICYALGARPERLARWYK